MAVGEVGIWPPNYTLVFGERLKRLVKLRQNVAGAKAYYAENPVEFIEHWCVTEDPRNAGTDLPVRLPFILFKRQREFIEFLHALLKGQESGLVEKARDVGCTWLGCVFSVWLWLFCPGAAIGWGSRKEELVDRIGDPKAIFPKIRSIIENLPKEFLPVGFAPASHMTYMKVINPENGATIAGEGGKNIGRGGRTTIYFLDEAAFVEHPEEVDAALGQNTRVEVDISSVSGLGNLFYRRRMAGAEWIPGQPAIKGRVNVFIMDWRDNPLKSQEWYSEGERKAIDEGMLHVWRSEVDRDYASSVLGVIIPAAWVTAAIDAHIKLCFDDSGGWTAGLDVADGGGDRNALAIRKGVILKSLAEWSEIDTGKTARRAATAGAEVAVDGLSIDLQYDCIGVGSGVKAETNRLMEERLMPRTVRLTPWNAGAAVLDPEGHVIPNDRQSPKNKDFYSNLKAQAWWTLRRRFEKTWRAINEPDFTWEPGELISLPSSLPLLRSLQRELSQPTASQGSRMKMVVDKAPDGTKSPNLADAVVMAFWPVGKSPLVISNDAMRMAMGPRR